MTRFLIADNVLECSLAGAYNENRPQHHSLRAAVNSCAVPRGTWTVSRVTTLVLQIVWRKKKVLLLNRTSEGNLRLYSEAGIKPSQVKYFLVSMNEY